MRKLQNPFETLPEYYCFGCSAKNHHGLQMEFFEDGDDIVSKWEPKDFYQGYIDVLHGGIQSTLMDEIASWVVFVKMKTGGVTSRLTSRFRKPVSVNEGPLTIRARLREQKRQIAVIDVQLFNARGVVCSESVAEYYVMSEEQARKEMKYPGAEAFYG
ncbi:MAG: PaaI family thioesterase [Bacteroidales bacterium]|nr:PaaI family thioesterase [Bacteroidales bacterium]